MEFGLYGGLELGVGELREPLAFSLYRKILLAVGELKC